MPYPNDLTKSAALAWALGERRKLSYRASWRLMRDGMGEQYRNFVDALTHEVRSTQPRSLSDLWIKYKVEEAVAG